MKKYIPAVAIIIILLTIGILGLGSHGDKSKTDSTSNSPAKASNGTYVALGDSVAAGIGLKDDSDSSACDRTNQSYPNLVAQTSNYSLSNLACSGATFPAGILGHQDVNQLMVTSQLDQLFAKPKPALVSITVGANDAQWTTFFAKCYTGICGSADDTSQVKQRLVTVGSNLQKTLTQIQQHYGSSPPRVVVTGYHQVFPTSPTAGCTDLTGVDASELSWGRQQLTAIDDTLQGVTKTFSFAQFATVNFDGHELCSADPWVQGLSDKEPYHPTAEGQMAYAKQVETAARNTK